jgi:hypothetical protein
LAFRALVVTLVTVFSPPYQARGMSGVLKISDLIGMNLP